MEHLVRVSQAEKAGLPFKPATFYDWKHKGKYPQIFISLGGALFVDRVALDALLEMHRGTEDDLFRRGRKRRVSQ